MTHRHLIDTVQLILSISHVARACRFDFHYDVRGAARISAITKYETSLVFGRAAVLTGGCRKESFVVLMRACTCRRELMMFF